MLDSMDDVMEDEMAKGQSPNRKSETFDAYLKRKNLTSADFALRSGVPYNSVIKWRNAGRKPRSFVAKVLSERFPDCAFFRA